MTSPFRPTSSPAHFSTPFFSQLNDSDDESDGDDNNLAFPTQQQQPEEHGDGHASPAEPDKQDKSPSCTEKNAEGYNASGGKVAIHYPFVVPQGITLTTTPVAQPSQQHPRLYAPLSHQRILHIPRDVNREYEERKEQSDKDVTVKRGPLPQEESDAECSSSSDSSSSNFTSDEEELVGNHSRARKRKRYCERRQKRKRRTSKHPVSKSPASLSSTPSRSSSSSSASPSSGSRSSPQLNQLFNACRLTENAVANVHRDAWDEHKRSSVSLPPSITVPSDILSENFDISLNHPARYLPSQQASPSTSFIPNGPLKPLSHNSISSLQLDGSPPSIVYAYDGTLSSLCTLNLKRPEPCLSTKFNYSKLPKFLLEDSSQIVHLETVDRVGDDKPFICTLSNCDVLSFSSVNADTSEIEFNGYIDNIKDILDISVNSYSYETCVLTNAGMQIIQSPEYFINSAATNSNSGPRIYDDNIQPVDPKYCYNQINHLPHPRLLLLASLNKISVFDIRSDEKYDKTLNRKQLNNIHSLSLVSNNDFQFFAYHDHFNASYYDLRYPNESILKQSYEEIGSQISNIYTKRVKMNESYQDLLIMYSSQSNYFNLSHVCHLSSHKKDLLGVINEELDSKVAKQVEDYTNLLKSNIVWADEPLQLRSYIPFESHQRNFGNVQTGMEILTSLKDNRNEMELDIVLYNSQNGLISIPVLLKTESQDDFLFQMDTSADETVDWKEDLSVSVSEVQQRKTYTNDMRNKQMFDNTVNMKRIKDGLGQGQGICDPAHPVTRNTGTKLLSQTGRLSYKTTVDIRKIIMSCKHDEKTVLSSGRSQCIPRTQSLPVPPEEDADGGKDLVYEMKQNGGGMLMNEVAHYLRGHSRVETPLSNALGTALENSPFIANDRAIWHEGCKCSDQHANRNFLTSVATDDDEQRLPDWVDWDVYYPQEDHMIEQDGEDEDRDEDEYVDEYVDSDGDSDEDDDGEQDISQMDPIAPEQSQLGQLMKRMQTMFLED